MEKIKLEQNGENKTRTEQYENGMARAEISISPMLAHAQSVSLFFSLVEWCLLKQDPSGEAYVVQLYR